MSPPHFQISPTDEVVQVHCLLRAPTLGFGAKISHKQRRHVLSIGIVALLLALFATSSLLHHGDHTYYAAQVPLPDSCASYAGGRLLFCHSTQHRSIERDFATYSTLKTSCKWSPHKSSFEILRPPTNLAGRRLNRDQPIYPGPPYNQTGLRLSRCSFDEDGGDFTWTILRLGILRTRGYEKPGNRESWLHELWGGNPYTVHVSDPPDMEAGTGINAQFHAPFDMDGHLITFPPLRLHHSILWSVDNSGHYEGVTKPAHAMVFESDYPCSSGGSGLGAKCYMQQFPDEYVARLPRRYESIRTLFIDTRTEHALAMAFSMEWAHRWTKRMDPRAVSWARFDSPFEVLTSPDTFLVSHWLPPNATSAMWYGSEFAFSGELLDVYVHSHHTQDHSTWIFASRPTELGLNVPPFVKATSAQPFVLEEVGIDATGFIARMFDYLERSISRCVSTRCSRKPGLICRSDIVGVEAMVGQGHIQTGLYGRKVKIECNAHELVMGDPWTVVVVKQPLPVTFRYIHDRIGDNTVLSHTMLTVIFAESPVTNMSIFKGAVYGDQSGDRSHQAEQEDLLNGASDGINTLRSIGGTITVPGFEWHPSPVGYL